MSCVKTANKQDQFKQKFKQKRKRARATIYFSLFQTSHSRKISTIFATSVIEVGIPLRSLKLCFGFFLLILDKALERTVRKVRGQSS